MRILFIDTSGDGLLDLAIRAKALGHQVKFFLQSFDAVKRPVGKGLVELVPDFHPWVNWSDLILLAGNGRYMREAESWRREGRLVIGGNPESASWELDRLKGMQVLQRAGVPVPPYRHCRSLDEAIHYVEERDEGVAAKPCGDIADKSLSVVGKTAKEVLWNLHKWKKAHKSFPSGVIIQDRVEGVEFQTAGWFGPEGFIDGSEQNAEGKRFFPGDLGPNTGEQYTVTRFVNKCKLFDKVLKPLEEQLFRIGYVGNCSVNCVIDKDGGPMPLEFTMRFGYPSVNAELALHQSDPIEFLACVAAGEKPPPRIKNQIAIGIVMGIPPHPFGHAQTEDVVGVPVWGVTPGIEDNLHFCDMMMAGDELQTAGQYVLVSTGVGDTVVEARNQALRVLNRLTLPVKPYWRIDAGSRLRSGLDELHQHGYAAGMNYA